MPERGGLEIPAYLDPEVVIAPGIRAELDQTPEWWDRQYRALVRKHIPRDAASHEGHRLIDLSTYATKRYACGECDVEIDPHAAPHSPAGDSGAARR